MNIIEVIKPECIVTGAAPKSKDEALLLAAVTACKASNLSNISPQDIVSALKQREALGTTGFGDGIAIPHCRLDGIIGFSVGMITVPDGVDFDSLDNQKVKLIIFIIGPGKDTTEHIRLLSSISRILQIPHAINEFQSQTCPEALYESFIRYSGDQLTPKDAGKKALIHLFVQDESIFTDLLNVFPAVDSASTSVIDARPMSGYLLKTPLFMGLWSDNTSDYAKLIVSVVDKHMTNETIRRIEQITGPLSERNDIMVTVQDLFYAAGAIN